MKNILIALSSREGSELSEFEKIYIDLFRDVDSYKINIIFDLSSYNENIRYECLVCIGYIPSWVARLNGLKIVHIPVDKYYVQSAPIEFKSSYWVLISIIKKIYRSVKPDLVVVNNELMAKDFELCFSYLNIKSEIKILPHPITANSRELRDKIFKIGARQKNDKYLLFTDSGHFFDRDKISGHLKSKCRDLKIKSISYKKRKEVVSFLIRHDVLAYLNYRAPHYGISYFNLKDLKNIIKYSVLKSILYFNVVEFVLSNRTYASNYLEKRTIYKTINSRWKPNTKLGVSISMGLPLITKSEYGIDSFSEEIGRKVYVYRDLDELAQVCGAVSEDKIKINDVDYFGLYNKLVENYFDKIF